MQQIPEAMKEIISQVPAQLTILVAVLGRQQAAKGLAGKSACHASGAAYVPCTHTRAAMSWHQGNRLHTCSNSMQHTPDAAPSTAQPVKKLPCSASDRSSQCQKLNWPVQTQQCRQHPNMYVTKGYVTKEHTEIKCVNQCAMSVCP